ncbi:MAG: PepSY domain-containing protein [Nitrososphaeraceae archaeon]
MKIILATTTLIALLVIGIIGINTNIGNAFAQMSSEDLPMEEMMDDETVSMTMSNQSEPMVNWTGTIEVESTIAEALKSKVNVNMIDAIKAAQGSVGLNSTVKEAELTHAHNYLVYKIMVVDEDMKKYKFIVDPGNGEILMKKEITWYDDHAKMKCEGMGDKSGHDYKMMMKDKKY